MGPVINRDSAQADGAGCNARERTTAAGATDAYLCPGGHRLEPRYQSVNRGHSLVHDCNREACRACPLKPGCTSGSYRRLSRWSEEAVLDRMEARLITRPDLLQRRREIAEHPFGSISNG